MVSHTQKVCYSRVFFSRVFLQVSVPGLQLNPKYMSAMVLIHQFVSDDTVTFDLKAVDTIGNKVITQNAN